MVLTDYTYIFVIGTFFAMLDAYNNGASKFTPLSLIFVKILTRSQMTLPMPGPPVCPLGPSRTDKP